MVMSIFAQKKWGCPAPLPQFCSVNNYQSNLHIVHIVELSATSITLAVSILGFQHPLIFIF